MDKQWHQGLTREIGQDNEQNEDVKPRAHNARIKRPFLHPRLLNHARNSKRAWRAPSARLTTFGLEPVRFEGFSWWYLYIFSTSFRQTISEAEIGSFLDNLETEKFEGLEIKIEESSWRVLHRVFNFNLCWWILFLFISLLLFVIAC